MARLEMYCKLYKLKIANPKEHFMCLKLFTIFKYPSFLLAKNIQLFFYLFAITVLIIIIFTIIVTIIVKLPYIF